MSKVHFLLLCLLFCLSRQQTLSPILLLPTETTQSVSVDYAFKFYTDTNIPNSASITLTFPFEYDPRELIKYTGCYFSNGSAPLQQRPCTISLRTFTVNVGQIQAGTLTIFIKNIKNPVEASMSSFFTMKTLFRDVTITEILQFGKLPFTKPSIIATSTGLVYNYENNLVEQGSTWVFRFTLSGSYAQNSTIRFVFPEGFTSNKVQCNITGIADSTMQTRVFPQGNIYDCLNVKATLSGSQNIILSGVVNPPYEMQMQGLQVQIIQPNNLVILQKISITNQPAIIAKTMNTTITIPNKFRNNTLTYIFEINMDSTLTAGDYIELKFAGNWTFFLNDSSFIEGVESSRTNKARFQTLYNWPTSSKVLIKNFSSISKESQLSFYLSLRTPILNSFYNLTISAFRANGKMTEFYTKNIEINQTTGYIKEMKLHPMNQAIKLPVGQTGPLQITLALRNNLPKTNVLTHGKVVIDITPHIPYPDVVKNGVIKCYFYGDIAAKNCTYTVDTFANPTVTHVIAYTPVDFNFQSSEIPFMVTTQGYQTEDDEGLTIDTLVKRYHFRIQFYTDYSPLIPTEVIFTEWVADAIPLTTFACSQVASQGLQWNHLKCTFTTPNQILNDGHIHIMRVQFSGPGWQYALGYTDETLYPDYPCLVYGANIVANPYPKCDLYTHYSNQAYKSDAGVSYINIYGIELIPANSAITFEFPKLKKSNWWNPSSLNFSILEDTYGYETHYIGLYSQPLTLQSSNYVGSYPIAYTATAVTVTMSNSVVNKVGDITLTGIDLGVAAVDYVILQVDQTYFPDIGRAQMFTCGSHKCSKFNKPVQYFILYPQTALARYQNLVFPSIANPSQAGAYTFYLRAYQGYSVQMKISFTVTITPDTLAAPVYTWASYETITQMYPNTNHFYKVSWTLINKLAQQTSYIKVIFPNIFTLVSTYCDLTTTVQSWDGKGVECEVWKSDNKVFITNMRQTVVGQNFTLVVQMSTSSASATLSPLVSIYTYNNVNGGSLVDQVINAPFSPASIVNTNLQTMTTFDFSKSYEFSKPIKKGYFGDLIVYYDPGLSTGSTNSIYTMILTFTSQFYPYSNALNLPLSCRINGQRYVCSYTLNPFEVTITGLTNVLTASSSNVVNITTEYLERDGIYFPSNQGRYLLKAQVLNLIGTLLQNSEQFVDIKPERIQYFNVSYAHRDANLDNIFTAEFQNGNTAISAYNDAANASRIYIGFPRVNSDGSGTVFLSNLGFSNGSVIPCYFQTGADYALPLSGKSLQCRLRRSSTTSVPVYVQIINFASIAAGKKIRVFMGKIRNPATKIIDMNFNLKVNYFNPTTFQETPQYENEYNLFIDMLDSSISTPTAADKTSLMFESGAKVGDTNKYINHIPLTMSGNSFVENDWFIVVMNSEFQLNGVLNNCIYNFYKRCIVFKEINWVAININNGTLIPFYPQVTQLPLSISRLDTYYQCFTWKAQRWTETITYTISASDRWMELRGAISNFNLQVLGSQNKLNIGQKDVDVLVSFTVSHKVPIQGTIEIKFPSDATKVPSIKPHCRSAVSMGSQLYGQKTGKPATNKQGQVGCLVQNSYSWLITSYEQLAAGSQVMVSGVIDFPTVLTSTLGTGYVVTYMNEDATNVFANGRIIDYLSTNFPLQVENKTWNLVEEVSLVRSQPLRINHVGKFEFKLQMQDYIRTIGSYYTGYIDVNFWKTTILGDSGGFSAPSGNSVCSLTLATTGQKSACLVDSVSSSGSFINYRLKFYYTVSANTPYIVTITTQNGNSNEGINFPSVVGTYKIETQIMYYTNYSSPYPTQASKAHFIEVYGPKFNALNLVSSVNIPAESNLLLLEIVPSSTITNNYHRIVIEIPTISNDAINLFDQDLGMGYRNYDDLVFDIYDSSITSMKCKVHTGDRINQQPIRIICNQFSLSSITILHVIRFGFWVKNPNTTLGLAIPIQVYVEQVRTSRKLMWQMLQAGVKVIPSTVSPVNDFGNFVCDTPYRQVQNTNFKFTNRNTQPLLAGDYYILKFNFDLRNSDKKTSAFKYPYSAYTNTGDAIFLRNSKTILLKVGAAALNNWVTADAGQSNKLNVMLYNVMYNPATKLSNSESQITAYAVYMATQTCQKIIHKDAFPTLSPNEPVTPAFTMTAINSNLKKGQFEDYKFSFRMNNDILTDTSLVKKISIQFPAYTTYDFTFRGQSCIEDPSSAIQIKKCVIDTSGYTIWIDPVQKGSYINSDYLIFQTVGKAIVNPVSVLGASSRMYLNNFVIKYYTWADDNNPPAIFASSDDYCFMKQDISQLSGTSYLTYIAPLASTRHDFVQLSQQVYVNEFLPLSSDIGTATSRVKTPLEFKFIAMTAFASQENTSYYHLIKVNYGTYYSITSQSRTNGDLYRYIPVCQLNGYRILSCSINSGTNQISMNFQQAIAANDQVSVRFSILDPTDSTSDGFTVASTSYPIATLPVYITPYGGTSYYMEAQPFPTFYKTSGITYPSMGISSATVSYGTQVYAKMNYLDFVIKFSRSDVNGLILEIPLIEMDGNIIYSNPALLGLDSGAEYPCSVGHGMNVFCYYEKGETKTYGKPTRIYISRWAMPATNILSFRMLFTNPDIVGVFTTFKFKAYGGTVANSKFMGEQFMGEYTISNVFKTLSQVSTYYTTSAACYPQPNSRLYSTSTNVLFYIDNDIAVNNYVMLEWTLHDTTYEEVSLYKVYNNTDDYDYMMINYAHNNRKLYIIKKMSSAWNGYTNGGGSITTHHDFGYLRTKHFLVNTAHIYYFEDPLLTVYTCAIDETWHIAYRNTNQYAFEIAYLDIQDKISGNWGWQFLSIDMGSTNPSTLAVNTTDTGEMVVVVKWIANLPYTALSSNTNDCSLEDGLRNLNILNPITCTIDSTNNQIIFKNVNKFTGRYLKFYYYARTLGSSTYNHQVSLRAYANLDAFTATKWEIFSDTTGYYTMEPIYMATDGTYSSNMTTAAQAWSSPPEYIINHDTDSGYVKITSLSSTQISFDVVKGATTNFPADVYKMSFRFYVPRLTFSGTCSVSAEPVSQSGRTCTPSGHTIVLNYSYYDSSGNNAHNWPAWSAGETYSFTFGMTITGEMQADYLFVSLAYSWYVSTYYYRSSQCGTPGCICNQCPESSALDGSASQYCSGYDIWSNCNSWTYYSNRYCRYWSCRWYWQYGNQFISGKGASTSAFSSTISPVSSYYGDLISYQKSVQTQLMVHFTNFQMAVGPTQESYLMFQINGQSFTNGNPFPYTTTSEIAAQIQCKCLLASTGTISISSGTSYLTPQCVRFLPTGLQPSVAINLDISVGQDLRCYFPGYLTTSSTVHNIDIFVEQNNYHHTDIPRAYWSKYSSYNQIDVGMNNYGVAYGISFDDFYDYVGENNFWTSTQTTNSRYYDLNFSIPYYEAYPQIYMSMYAPKPVSAFCSSASFSECRFYDTFINRKYFFVAKSASSSISSWNIAGTSAFSPSIDNTNTNYQTLLYVSDPTYSRYLSSYSNSRSTLSSIIAPSTNTKSIQPSMFGSFLQTYNSSIIASVYLAGKKLYSNTRNYGPYQGSFMKVTFSGLTNLKGCAATLKTRPINLDAPLYCEVISISEINIFSKNDLTITDQIYFTVYTAGLPASSTYTVELFDKYISATVYARSFAVSGTLGRSKGGYTTVDPTQIHWRRPAYKQYQTTSGPVRFTFKSNFQYVSDYNVTTLAQSVYSDAVVVSMPSGFTSSDSYICYAKEYSPGKKSLYKRFQVPCGYWSYNTGNKVYIKPLLTRTFKPIYYYEFVIYRNLNSSTMLITLPTTDVYSMEVISSSQINSEVVVFYDYFDFYKYKTVYPSTLNSIYILTRQAAANNSLYIDFTLNLVGTASTYFQFQIPNLGLSSFKIDKGEEIPCYLSDQFVTISGKTQSARCFGYTNSIGTDSPLIIRVFGMSAWTTGTNFKLSFDNFNNPSIQKLFLVPIDITFRYIDRTNRRSYISSWPSVYISDSINMGSATEISGTLSRTDNNRGANNIHYIGIGWPYTSSSDSSQKMVLKVAGGVTCCQAFSSISLRDNYTPYTLLWRNTKANVSVWVTPAYGAGTGRNLWVNNVNNPYPYQRDTYQKLKKIEILFYSNYQGLYSKKVDQFSYSSYSMYNEFTIDSSPALIDSTSSFYFHQQYPMTYRFAFSTSRNQFNNRQLSYTLLTFTSGVTGVDWAHADWSASPYYFNNLMQVTIGKNINNQYFVNISGMSDSSYYYTEKWYVEVKFYTSSNTVSYLSQTYALNGQLEFTNSQTLSISTNTFRTDPYAPTTLQIRQQKYFNNFYELQRIPIYAKSSNTATKLQFRFTTPYNIINQQTITLTLSDNTELYPINSPTTIYCLIRQTITSTLSTGISRWAPCTYTTGTYTITNPIGDLTASTEYTITILQRNQTTSSFKLPSQPKRVQVSSIYTSQLNLMYGDVYELDFAGRMNSITWTHASVDLGALNMIGVNFNPQFTLNAASLTAPVTQTIVELQIYAKEFDSCIGAKSMFTTDGAYFASGTYFSHYSTPAVTNANTRIKCGQHSQSFAPIKLTTTDYGQVTASTAYYFRYPLIQNPSAGAYIPFLYRFRLLQYKNGVYYPNLIATYEYEGLESTRNGNTYGETGSVSASNDYVQSTMSLSFSWPNFNQGSGSQTWIKWKNNEIQALTDITALTSTTNANYDYQFYPNINLCVFVKNSNVDDRTVSLGSFPTNDDIRAYKISWAHIVYTDKLNRQADSTLSYATNDKTSWTSASFTLVSGLKSTSSQGIFRISWSSSTLRFVEGSYMKITLMNSYFIYMDEYCKTMSGFLPGSAYSSSNLICRRTSTTEITIEGYQTISTGTALSIDVYLQMNTNSVYTETNSRVYIQVFSKDDKAIIQAYTGYLASYAMVQGAQILKLQDAMRYKFMKDTSRSLLVQFKLASNSLGQSQYVEIDFGNWQLDTSTTGQVIASYIVGSNYYYTPAVFTLVSANKYRFGVYKNISTYTIPAGTLVTLKIDHINPDNFYGILVPNIKWNYIKITAHSSGGTVLEHQYAQIWVQPYNHISLNVQPALDYVNAVSIYDFTVTPNVTIAAGDFILLQFATGDGLYSDLFSNNLGKTINTNDSTEISCRETNDAKVISNTAIKCELFKGDITVSPTIPTTVQIKVLKSIAANQLISFNILSLMNPSRASYPIGVTFKLASICYQSDQNRLCPYYKSTKYISFNNAVIPPATGSNYGSLSFNPSLVSATSSKHTVSAGITLNIGDFVKIVYYPEVTVGETCSLQGGNGVCYAYPLQNTIIIKATVLQSGSYSFILNGMTNLYQYSGSHLYTQIWQVSTRTIISSFYTSYTVPIITTDPNSNNPLSITFTPTLTDNYELSYNFDNIAKVQISYLLQNNKIQQILLTAPTGISLNSKYCNATLQSTAAQAKPYPFRFKCEVISSWQVRITKNSNFPAWTAAFINKKITVYLMYTISTSLLGLQTSNWVATTYTDPVSTASSLRVSQAVGNFYVEVYQSPYIYKIDFFTYSFTKRICQAGEKCMFYGYLLPSTLQANFQIKYFDYTIPSEFIYSNLLSYDNCDMKEKNSDSYAFSCTASRNTSKVTVRLLPTTGGYLYNHNYKLIKIDNKNATRLFNAPQYPGTHYQMKVDLYTTADVLIQSQYVNLTTVYGKLLNWNDIQITIPQDASTIGVFDFTFRVGSVDIQPAYESSSTNRIVSAIEVIFSNSFDFDLGTGKKAGEQVGCLPILNLNLKTMGKLTCRIYPSYSTITNPTIIVTGYDKILNGQLVTFKVAGLKSLPVSVTDYIKIGVSYRYYDYGNVKGYIHEPTGKVVGPVTAKNSLKNIGVTITETSTNIVGELVNYSFTCTFDAAFAPVTTNDFVGIQFPLYGFEGRFNQNQKALCSPATNQLCYSFGATNVIYFKPSTAISSTTFTFTLNQNINTAFSFDYKTIPIKVFTVISGKLDSLGTGSIVKFSKPSTNISGLITKTDSNYGGESGISYYIDFKIGTYLPETGKISITFPSVYASLFDLNCSCSFTSDTLSKIGEAAYCQIVSSNQLIIAPNGLLMDKDTTYTVVVSNLTNPNANITSNLFKIQAFYSGDIYQKKIISQNTFSPPEINVLSVKSCQFDLTIQTTNQNYKSFYSMAFICPSVIKQASRLQIFLPWNLTASEKQLCTSDTSSLYSYQCSIKNDYVNNTLVSFMEIFLRSHVPQKLVQIKGEITNGVKGSYTVNASISYKSFTYLTATSNKVYIDDTTVKTLTKMEIQVQNYPYNRNYESLYTFKITNPKIIANSLRIELSSVITQGPNGITCNSELSSTSKDYFTFLALYNTTDLTCSMSGQSILINGLSSIIKALKDDQFLFIDVFGLKNPDVSVDSQDFKFTFLNITESTGNVIGTITSKLPYKVSQAPLNLQINSFSLSSSKFQVITNYTITSSTIASTTINITAQSDIGIKIKFPQEYASTWSITPSPTQVKIYLGANLYTGTSIYMVNRQLMVRFTVGSYESFSQVKVVFEFRNPSDSINCTASNFIVSLFDFKQNSILAETVGNNAACLQLSDKLYWIKISGNSQILAGNFSLYTIEIQKPGKYLKITPIASTSAISFSPSEIVFQNYSSTIQQFKIIGSPVFSGSFLISFIKQEQGLDLFYNDIKNETVTLVAPTTPYMINFEQLSAKSIGQPIETFINIQVPSSIAFALLHSNNCSSNYDITPVGRINVPARASQVSFSVKYNGGVIPYMCAVRFEISSLTTINYALSTNILYLSGQPSIDKTNSLRPMILRITKQPKDSKDVGTSILTSDTKSTLKPMIYNLKDKNIKTNLIQLEISLSEPGFVYFVAMEVGTQIDKITQQMIYDQNIKTDIIYNKTRATLNTVGSVNILTDLFLNGLQSDKRYLIAVYLNSTVGLSDIKFKEVQTLKSSNGAVIKICFNSIQDNSTVLNALSTILRIKTDRLSVFTMAEILLNISGTWSTQVMNPRRYVYEVVLAPNRYDDSISPLQSFNSLIGSKDLQNNVKAIIPSFDLTYSMITHELILAKPKIRGKNITVQQLTYHNVKVSVQFWEVAYVYGVIVPADKSKPSLLTKQIIDGLNRENIKLNATHRVSTQTSNEGVAILEFRLLSEQNQYEIFITAECVLPYEPRAQLSDNEVLKQSIKTTTNLNVVNNGDKVIEQLKAIKNDQLAEAVKQHILSVEQKKVLNQKVTRIRNKK